MNGTNETGRLIEKYLPVDYHDTFSVQTDVNGYLRRRSLQEYSRIIPHGSGLYTNSGPFS